jgi:methyl-accepting chemotaxis protein WspA
MGRLPAHRPFASLALDETEPPLGVHSFHRTRPVGHLEDAVPKHWSLRTRLFALVGAFFVVFVAFGAVATYSLRKIAINGPVYQDIVDGKDIIADVLPPPLYIIESFLLAHELVQLQKTADVEDRIERGARLRKEYDERHEYWSKRLEEGKIRQYLLVEEYAPALEFFRLRDQEFLPAIRSGDRERARAILLGPLSVQYEAHRKAVDVIVTETNAFNQRMEVKAADMLATSNSTMLALGLLAVAVVLALVVVADGLATRLTTDLAAASDAAHRVASGDLTVSVEGAGGDESKRLLNAISQMAASLAQLVARAQKSSIDLLSTAAELAATSREQETTVAGFGASTSEIAAAVTEISATSRELLTTMTDVSRVAVESAQLAQNGRSGLERMDATMSQLSRATANITSRLSTIQEKAADINVVVTTITKVADQTNLLSINAAIEAEKAGEYGLGFLVLAREIRRLADQTAVATLDIEHIVKQMQSAVTAGVMEMDRFNADVRVGVATVEQVGSQLGSIIAQVSSLSERFEAVNDGMRSQSDGARQIKEAMASLTEGARQTSTSLGEFKLVSDNLRSAASELRESIAGFRVGS